MSDVTFTRREYNKAARRWKLVRDFCAGAEAVKAMPEAYLPRPNPHDKSEENRKRYETYVERAQFYGATGHTKLTLVGAAFRTWPTLTVSTALDLVKTDVDGKGVSIYQQSQDVVGHILETGRHGLLVDYPAVDGSRVSVADQQSGGVQPTICSYPAEAVINWKYRRVGSKQLLCLVVLKECVDKDTPDGFGTEEVTQYRVLRLDDAGNYTQEVWSTEGKVTTLATPAFTPNNSSGQPWKVIPFTFVGSQSNDASVDPAPLYDMAELNKGHYRNSADYEDSTYLVGQPQVFITGLDEQWRDYLEKAGIYVGSRSILPLPVGGAAGILQPLPNTMVKEAMDAKERQLVAIGARLFEPGSAAKTATQDQNESAAEHSVLSLVVSNVNEAYEQCLRWYAEFAGVTGEVTYKISQDYTQITLDPQVMDTLLKGVQAGRIPVSAFWQYLRDRGIIGAEKTDDELRDELEQQDPSPGPGVLGGALDDGEGGNGDLGGTG